MAKKDLRKLSRKQILEIMIAQAKEIDRLNALVEEMQQKQSELKYSSRLSGRGSLEEQ